MVLPKFRIMQKVRVVAIRQILRSIEDARITSIWGIYAGHVMLKIPVYGSSADMRVFAGEHRICLVGEYSETSELVAFVFRQSVNHGVP